MNVLDPSNLRKYKRLDETYANPICFSCAKKLQKKLEVKEIIA